MFTRSLSACCLLLASVALAAIPSDEITALPGWPYPLPSKQYSGLISVNNATGKAFHYVFVESESNSSNVPLVLWLNGGPGCSSLDGLLYEHGPFRVNESDTSSLVYNPYTWAKVAAMLYLESPTGVGFSFSKSVEDYFVNDTVTAEDNFIFLTSFLASYPEYADRDFYITGESYAGVYIPTLAARILAGNAAGASSINLKGIAVGNGCTGVGSGVCGTLEGELGVRADFLEDHGLVSARLTNGIREVCNFTSIDSISPDCLLLVVEATSAIGNVNIYDIYDVCITGGRRLEEKNVRSRRVPSPSGLFGPDACIDGIAAAAYLNTPDVIEAFHVSPAMPAVKSWVMCSTSVQYTQTAENLPKTVYPSLASSIRILIFNGDVDCCVPYTDNEAWTSSMGFPVVADWHPWTLNGQVAGYATVYSVPGNTDSSSFTFATIKGAGHMVAQYEPAPALDMFTRFLNNAPF